MRLCFNTGNPGKIVELRRLLSGVPVAFSQAPCEENGESFHDNALIKARALSIDDESFRVGEDSGICIPDLGGYPGIYSARAWSRDPQEEVLEKSRPENVDEFNNHKIQQLLRKEGLFAVYERGVPAYYHSAIAVVSPADELVWKGSGTLSVRIVEKTYREAGFGYDWIVEHEKGHLGRMSPEIKSSISHRAIAVKRLLGWWKTL